MIICPVCRGDRIEFFTRVPDRDRPRERLWEVWRCDNCGYGFTRPEISPADIGQYYPPVYLGDTEKTLGAYLEGRLQQSRSWRRETEKVRLVEQFCSEGRILDVGASNGSFLLALDPGRWQRVGVEYIPEVVEMVRSRVPDLEFHQGDIYSDRLKAGQFDVITFWHVFEHLFEPRKILDRTRRLLKPRGVVVISVPNFDSRQARFFGRHWYALDLPRHLHHFSPRALEILLDESGFQLERHIFFSRLSNMHQLKYSLIHWSEERFSSRTPYYLLKPLLMTVPWLEALGKNYGTLTTVARKP